MTLCANCGRQINTTGIILRNDQYGNQTPICAICFCSENPKEERTKYQLERAKKLLHEAFVAGTKGERFFTEKWDAKTRELLSELKGYE